MRKLNMSWGISFPASRCGEPMIKDLLEVRRFVLGQKPNFGIDLRIYVDALTIL